MTLVSLSDFKAPAQAREYGAVKAEGLPSVYVPMQSNKKFADGTPVNSLMVKQRREVLKEWFGEKWRDGSIGVTYKSWLYTILSVIAVLFFWGVNLWVSAVFAYLAGYFWSEMLLNYAWTLEWYKNKALISTK